MDCDIFNLPSAASTTEENETLQIGECPNLYEYNKLPQSCPRLGRSTNLQFVESKIDDSARIGMTMQSTLEMALAKFRHSQKTAVASFE